MVKDDSKPLLTCFKYRSGATALRCLVDGALYFAGPSQLNDLLETKFDHADAADFDRVFRETIAKVNRARGGAPIQPAREIPLQFIQENARENERFRQACDNVGIFSAARRPNDQAMWAYYAEDCKGVCFELEWSASILNAHQLYPVDVTYSANARTHNRAEDWRATFLELAKEKPTATIAELQQISLGEAFRRRMGVRSTARAASIKHTDWMHEKEIRILAAKSGARLLLSSVLKRVHFIRTDGDQWGAIFQELHKNYPQVELAHWTFHHGEISASAESMEFKLVPVD